MTHSLEEKTLSGELAELEQEFRQSWRGFDPGRYSSFLDRASDEERPELLTRMLSIELEYFYQPPTHLLGDQTSPADDDDERVEPNVQLFVLRFRELRGRTDLIHRLVVLEYTLRFKYGRDEPNPDSYLPLYEQGPEQQQLPDLLDKIRQIIIETENDSVEYGPGSPSDSTVKESQPEHSIALSPLPFNLGCFLVIRMVGRGGMGHVYAAIDLRSTAQVAVKIMRRFDSWSVHRFIEEFSWLSELNHPNLVKLYDTFSEGDIRFFSMELVEGKTLRDWFRKLKTSEETKWRQLRRVLAQLASATEYLHEHGVLHCDIKCSNAMITPRRRAVLLDLGLAVRAGHGNNLMGTLQYMAPEILRGESPTYASDWYSFGLLIYEVITDRYPPKVGVLTAESVNTKEAQLKCQLDRETLADDLGACPSDLAELCTALLSTDPAGRPTGSETLKRLGGSSGSKFHFSVESECTGRDEAMSRMNASLASLKEFDSGLVQVRGESGLGKTTLLHHWTDQIPGSEYLYISVRCYRQDHTMLRLLNLLVQELVMVLAKLPEPFWRDSLEKRIKEIGLTFPQVRQLVDGAFPANKNGSSKPPTAAQRDVGKQSLLEWLVELSAGKQIILVIDDAQWADDESLQLLARLLSEDLGFRGLIVTVAEDGRSGAIESLQPDWSAIKPPARFTQIDLTPLDEPTCDQLLRSWANRLEIAVVPEVAANIVHRSAGNPFLLMELFRTYVHYARRNEMSATDWLSQDADSTVRRRFSMLPAQDERILQYLAVADQPLGFHQLQMVSRILPHKLQSTLSFLGSEGWIRTSGTSYESDVEIAHENFRKLVLRSLPKERMHRRNFRMARILSSETPPPWARIARHYWWAERYREAATCYLEAARSAAASCSYKEALYFLQRAIHPEAERSGREHANVLRIKADCLAGVGDSTEAAILYEKLLEEEESAEQRQLLACLAGEQWIRAGQLEQGLALLRDTLQHFGIVDRKGRALARIRSGCRTWSVAARILRWSGRPRKTDDEKYLSPVEQCLGRLAAPLTFLDGQLGPDLALRLSKLADDHGGAFDRCVSALSSGLLLSFAGRRWNRIALRQLKHGRRLARQCKEKNARATGRFCMFVWNTQRGLLRKAIIHGEAALQVYNQHPKNSHWETMFLRWGLLGCYWSTNQLRTLRESTALLRQIADQPADPMSLLYQHSGAAHWSDLVADEADAARAALLRVKRSFSGQTFQSPRYFLWISEIHQALYDNQPETAQQILAEGYRVDPILMSSERLADSGPR